MSKKRDCKRCNSPLIDMDPHTICKPCRQPDPQMFYCSEDDCEACNVIKVYKPLDMILRKQELKNIKKKIELFSNQHLKPNRGVPPLKNMPNEKKLKQPQTSNQNKQSLEEKTSDFSSEVLKTIMNSLYTGKERTDNLSPFLKVDGSLSNANTNQENTQIKDMERRLYDRIMSNLMTTMSYDSKINPSEIINNPSASSSPSSTASSSKSSLIKSSSSTKPNEEKVLPSNLVTTDFDKKESELQDDIISFFEETFPDIISKIKKTSNDNTKFEYSFKVSSRASNILANETILSSPSQATKLCEALNIEFDKVYWPINLKTTDLLNTNFGKLVSLKLHPKYRHMHTILFGKLNPSLPDEVVSESFILPEVSDELKNEFIFAREQLQRLILMFSILDHYIEGSTIDNSEIMKLFEILLNLLKICMEKQSNFVGLLVQEIRKDLLKDAECTEPDALSKLIFGPVHQTQFFGLYVKELAEIVKKNGSSYGISSKSENANVSLIKLPSKFKMGDSIEKFLENMELFFDANKTLDKDKTSVLESLLPYNLIDRISSFIKPSKISDKNFHDVSEILTKFVDNSSTYLLERMKFTNLKQTKGQSARNYAEELEKMLSKCMYGACSREILRDQFVFGLYDTSVQEYLLYKPSWSLEECLEYSETLKIPIENETRGGHTPKRKREDIEGPSKKPKVQFYNNSSNSKEHSKNKIISVSSLDEWNDYFGFDIYHTYQVYCPWTGQVLRG